MYKFYDCGILRANLQSLLRYLSYAGWAHEGDDCDQSVEDIIFYLCSPLCEVKEDKEYAYRLNIDHPNYPHRAYVEIVPVSNVFNIIVHTDTWGDVMFTMPQEEFLRRYTIFYKGV